MPLIVHFPNYAFNENIQIYCFHEWDVFLTPFLCQIQKLKSMSLLVLRKKKLLLVQFSVKFVVLLT